MTRKDGKEYVSLYQKKPGGIWYMNLRDPITGKKTRKSSGTRLLSEAKKIFDKEQLKLSVGSRNKSLRDDITMYLDPDSNPRKKQANLDGSTYGMHHAVTISYQAKFALQVIDKELLDMQLSDISAIHIKKIKECIVKAYGHTRKANALFIFVKSVFSQAHEDGEIDNNPASGMKQIIYEKKQRDSVDESVIRKIIQAGRDFSDYEAWAFFSIIATTGMRCSEVLALSEKQIDGNYLLINQALKLDSPDSIGLPKWGIIREIQLPDITARIIASLAADKNGRYFYRTRNWGYFAIVRIKARAIELFPEDKEDISRITAHVLRHSLNSCLICNGCSEVLVASYFGWNHQNLFPSQKGYTHIHAKNLKPISDAIDMIFQAEESRPIAGPAQGGFI